MREDTLGESFRTEGGSEKEIAGKGGARREELD
jgi:hypothetical protein